MYVVNGFYMAMREKYTKPGASLSFMTVEWDSKALSWADFRREVVGATDPKKAERGSCRWMILGQWKELGLQSEPDVGDNGMHASASPFEALAERMNWLGAAVATDEFGKAMLAAGISEDTVLQWTKDPQVTFEGKAQSLFDTLEDLDCSECLHRAQMIAGGRGFISATKNQAFVFIKPHAMTAQTISLVKTKFAECGIRIIDGGALDSTTISEKRLIDNHYYAIANKASLSKPQDLNPPSAKREEFARVFGLRWEEAVGRGLVYNAMDGCAKLGIDGTQMDAIWAHAKAGGKVVKFGGGFQCGWVTPPCPRSYWGVFEEVAAECGPVSYPLRLLFHLHKRKAPQVTSCRSVFEEVAAELGPLSYPLRLLSHLHKRKAPQVTSYWSVFEEVAAELGPLSYPLRLLSHLHKRKAPEVTSYWSVFEEVAAELGPLSYPLRLLSHLHKRKAPEVTSYWSVFEEVAAELGPLSYPLRLLSHLHKRKAPEVTSYWSVFEEVAAELGPLSYPLRLLSHLHKRKAPEVTSYWSVFEEVAAELGPLSYPLRLLSHLHKRKAPEVTSYWSVFEEVAAELGPLSYPLRLLSHLHKRKAPQVTSYWSVFEEVAAELGPLSYPLRLLSHLHKRKAPEVTSYWSVFEEVAAELGPLSYPLRLLSHLHKRKAPQVTSYWSVFEEVAAELGPVSYPLRLLSHLHKRKAPEVTSYWSVFEEVAAELGPLSYPLRLLSHLHKRKAPEVTSYWSVFEEVAAELGPVSYPLRLLSHLHKRKANEPVIPPVASAAEQQSLDALPAHLNITTAAVLPLLQRSPSPTAQPSTPEQPGGDDLLDLLPTEPLHLAFEPPAADTILGVAPGTSPQEQHAAGLPLYHLVVPTVGIHIPFLLHSLPTQQSQTRALFELFGGSHPLGLKCPVGSPKKILLCLSAHASKMVSAIILRLVR